MSNYRQFLAAACFAFPLLSRFYLLWLSIPLNVDEAHWTVSARSIFDDWVVWRTNDLTTSGPLNAMPIAWPLAFGMVPDLWTSRLTGFVLQSATLAGIATLLPKATPLSAGAGALLASVFLIAFTTNPDFLHYSSELLSTGLIVAFAMLATQPRRANENVRWFVCGLIATAIAFAKLQSALFTALLHAYCALRLLRAWKNDEAGLAVLASYVAGSLLPVLLLVAPLGLVGEMDAFVKGYLQLGAEFPGRQTLDVFGRIAPLLLLDAALMAWTLLRVRTHWDACKERWDTLALAVAIWPVAFLTVWLPGRGNEHYLLYAIFTLPLSVVLADGVLPEQARIGRLEWLGPAAAAVFGLAFAAAELEQIANLQRFVASVFEYGPHASDERSAPLLAWAGVDKNDKAMMWGWEPQYLAYADVRSADRTPHSEYLIRENRGRDYFRRRALEGLRQSPPAVVLDAARDGYFFAGYTGLSVGDWPIATFPELNELVARDYVRLPGPAHCAALYLRRDKAEALQAREAPLTSTASELVDGSISENCGDWWAPQGAEGSATLRPDRPTRLGEIWLLASRGGLFGLRGTPTVRLRYTGANGETASRTVKLHPYPRWTVVATPQDFEIASIDVELPDHVTFGVDPKNFDSEVLRRANLGPALNEVKAFRAR